MLLVLTGTTAFAHCRPENRVWGFSEKTSDFASQENVNPIAASGENPGCGYDFASGVHKYLYCQNDPMNMVDPSGRDGDIPTLDITMSAGEAIDAGSAGVTVKAFSWSVFRVITATIATTYIYQEGEKGNKGVVFHYDATPGKTYFPIGTYVTDNPDLSWSQAISIMWGSAGDYIYVYGLRIKPADLGPLLPPIMGQRQWQLENTVYGPWIVRTMSRQGGGSGVF